MSASIEEETDIVSKNQKCNDVPSHHDDDAHQHSKRVAQYIGKTVESFKLADLHWIESCVMAYCKQKNDSHSTMQSIDLVDRLAFHRPTASYLLGYKDDGMNAERRSLPFRPGRFQYVARVIAIGQTPQELLNNVEASTFKDITKRWVFDYDTFEPLRNEMHPKKSCSSTMLMCAVSRILPGEPSLNLGDDDVSTYTIVETASQLYLAEKISLDANGVYAFSESQPQSTHGIAKQFRNSWSRRPFQYSGAINLDVALTVIDILRDLLRSNEDNNASEEVVRIFDPTCGSGTFLALALMAWRGSVEAVGIDSNLKCAYGTLQNLGHLFSHAIDEGTLECSADQDIWELNITSDASVSSTTATIYSGDSTCLQDLVSQTNFDCAVANLPWNRNTFEFQGTNNTACANSDILRATASVLRPGAPLVVVSGGVHNNEQDKTEEDSRLFSTRTCLEDLGFHVIGEASIPPKGFNLPVSGKKKNVPKKKGSTFRSSDCMITVAVAPS